MGKNILVYILISLFVCFALLLLVGCSAREPLIKYELVEVKVPIQVKAVPPAKLIEPLVAPPPVFISPADPAASSALSREGEENLKRWLLMLHDRQIAWKIWAGT